MVEGESERPVAGVDDDGRPGVVGPLGPARRPGQKDRRDGVETRVPRRVGVGAELADELDLERGLFAGFPDGRRFERLAGLDEAAGEGPAGGRVLPLDQDDAPPPPAVHDLDDDVDGRERVSVLVSGHGALRSSGAIVGAVPRPCQFNLTHSTANPENEADGAGSVRPEGENALGKRWRRNMAFS